jgi:hypothetical protein
MIRVCFQAEAKSVILIPRERMLRPPNLCNQVIFSDSVASGQNRKKVSRLNVLNRTTYCGVHRNTETDRHVSMPMRMSRRHITNRGGLLTLDDTSAKKGSTPASSGIVGNRKVHRTRTVKQEVNRDPGPGPWPCSLRRRSRTVADVTMYPSFSEIN